MVFQLDCLVEIFVAYFLFPNLIFIIKRKFKELTKEEYKVPFLQAPFLNRTEPDSNIQWAPACSVNWWTKSHFIRLVGIVYVYTDLYTSAAALCTVTG